MRQAFFIDRQAYIPKMSIIPYFVYIIQSEKDGRYYIGSTQNLEERLDRHNQGRSKFTKGRGPWELVYSEDHPNRASAVKRENEIKNRKKKLYIERLIRTSRP